MKKIGVLIGIAFLLLMAGCDYFQKSSKEVVVAECYGKYLYESDLKGIVPEGASTMDSIQRDSIGYAFVRKGYYQKGDNQYVDQTEWKVGVRNEIPSTVDQSTTIVCIREVRKPEPKTLKEARGLVTSD